MQQPEKFQTYAYFAICMAVILAHELIYSLYAGTGRFVDIALQMAGLFAIAAFIDHLVAVYAAYKRRPKQHHPPA